MTTRGSSRAANLVTSPRRQGSLRPKSSRSPVHHDQLTRTAEQEAALIKALGLSTEPFYPRGKGCVYALDFTAYKTFVQAQSLFYGRAVMMQSREYSRSNYELACRVKTCQFCLTTREQVEQRSHGPTNLSLDDDDVDDDEDESNSNRIVKQVVTCFNPHTCILEEHLNFDLVSLDFLTDFVKDLTVQLEETSLEFEPTSISSSTSTDVSLTPLSYYDRACQYLWDTYALDFSSHDRFGMLCRAVDANRVTLKVLSAFHARNNKKRQSRTSSPTCVTENAAGLTVKTTPQSTPGIATTRGVKRKRGCFGISQVTPSEGQVEPADVKTEKSVPSLSPSPSRRQQNAKHSSRNESAANVVLSFPRRNQFSANSSSQFSKKSAAADPKDASSFPTRLQQAKLLSSHTHRQLNATNSPITRSMSQHSSSSPQLNPTKESLSETTESKKKRPGRAELLFAELLDGKDDQSAKVKKSLSSLPKIQSQNSCQRKQVTPSTADKVMATDQSRTRSGIRKDVASTVILPLNGVLLGDSYIMHSPLKRRRRSQRGGTASAAHEPGKQTDAKAKSDRCDVVQPLSCGKSTLQKNMGTEPYLRKLTVRFGDTVFESVDSEDGKFLTIRECQPWMCVGEESAATRYFTPAHYFFMHNLLIRDYDNLVDDERCTIVRFGSTLESAIHAVNSRLAALSRLDTICKMAQDLDVVDDLKDFAKSTRVLRCLEDQEKLERQQEAQDDEEERLRRKFTGRAKKERDEQNGLSDLIDRPVLFHGSNRNKKVWKAVSLLPAAKREQYVQGVPLPRFRKVIHIDHTTGACALSDRHANTAIALSEMKHSLAFIRAYHTTEREKFENYTNETE